MTNVTMLTSRRPRLLRQALESLGPTQDMTVTVLADNASDETVQVLKDSGVNYYVHHESKGTGIARNTVIKMSELQYGRGEWLYLSDDDVKFHPGWHGTLVTAYEAAWDHGFRVLGAYNHPYHLAVTKQALWGGWEVHEVHALALQSMIMRWEVWDTFGPFIETPPGAVCQGEDGAFSVKIKEAGFRVGVVSPALLVNCGVTNSFGQPIPGAEHVRAQAPAGVVVE